MAAKKPSSEKPPRDRGRNSRIAAGKSGDEVTALLDLTSDAIAKLLDEGSSITPTERHSIVDLLSILQDHLVTQAGAEGSGRRTDMHRRALAHAVGEIARTHKVTLKAAACALLPHGTKAQVDTLLKAYRDEKARKGVIATLPNGWSITTKTTPVNAELIADASKRLTASSGKK